ncbi:diacylglycerol kinase family protein [Sulfitobacter sp. HNIBRBA3233]|uniref:diacylglycerol/lipid kinase family protein n=1 Tax=Sulfitobacter marinivivus TaxID=3158558 RepID=UPI0032E00618
MPKKVIVILNRGSGGRDGETREATIRRAFARHGYDVDIMSFNPRNGVERAARAALEAKPDIIAVSGGDGTICAVASVMAGSVQTMAVIPSGTFNYFARSLDLPEDIDRAVDVIATGQKRPTNIAMINDSVFLNNTSIGAYSAILQNREGIYAKWGRSRIAAYWSVIKTLATFRAPLKITVTIDGTAREYRTPLVFVMNNAFQLDQMNLPGRAHIENGQMVLLIAPHTNRWGLLKNAMALGMGIAKPKSDYELHGAAEFCIDMKRKRRAVARDGEISKMAGPFNLRVVHGALDVIVPSETAATEAVR